MSFKANVNSVRRETLRTKKWGDSRAKVLSKMVEKREKNLKVIFRVLNPTKRK